MAAILSYNIFKCIFLNENSDLNVTESCLPVASFTKEGNSRLAKHPLVFNGHLANRGLTSLVKEAKESNWQ